MEFWFWILVILKYKKIYNIHYHHILYKNGNNSLACFVPHASAVLIEPFPKRFFVSASILQSLARSPLKKQQDILRLIFASFVRQASTPPKNLHSCELHLPAPLIWWRRMCHPVHTGSPPRGWSWSWRNQKIGSTAATGDVQRNQHPGNDCLAAARGLKALEQITKLHQLMLLAGTIASKLPEWAFSQPWGNQAASSQQYLGCLWQK